MRGVTWRSGKFEVVSETCTPSASSNLAVELIEGYSLAFVSKMAFVEGILRCLGPLCFIGLQISSISTALQVLKNRSVGQLSCIPFASLLVNCVIWSLYGILKDDYTILIPNFTGLLASIFCLWAYLKYNTANLNKVHAVSSALIIITAYLAFRSDYTSIGLLGCAISIIVSGSPLAVMRTVIAEKSTASMPFTTSLVMWVNNLSWFCYGYFISNDPMVYGPNFLGLALSSTQMVLFGIYGIQTNDYTKDEDKKSVEMSTQSLLSAVVSACDDV